MEIIVSRQFRSISRVFNQNQKIRVCGCLLTTFFHYKKVKYPASPLFSLLYCFQNYYYPKVWHNACLMHPKHKKKKCLHLLLHFKKSYVYSINLTENVVHGRFSFIDKVLNQLQAGVGLSLKTVYWQLFRLYKHKK